MPRVQVLTEVQGRDEEVVLTEHVSIGDVRQRAIRRPARRAYELGARPRSRSRRFAPN